MLNDDKLNEMRKHIIEVRKQDYRAGHLAGVKETVEMIVGGITDAAARVIDAENMDEDTRILMARTMARVAQSIEDAYTQEGVL